MESKDSKSRSQSKPQKGDTDAVTRKRPEAKPAEKKSEAESQNKDALDEAKARVEALKSIAVSLRAQIKSERAEAIHDPSVIQSEIERARLNWEKIQSELDKAKGLSRKRKDEIDEWKAWFEKLPIQAKQSQQLERLQLEIKWRADEIASNGVKINELIPQEFEARGVFEMAKLKLEALRAGVYQLLEEDDDPRLKGLLAELDKENAVVARLEPKRSARR